MLLLLLGCSASSDDTATPEGWCAVQGVFARECVTCHGEQAPDLVHDPWRALVNQTSVAHPERTYVVPGEPEASFLYLKLTGAQLADEGAAMPLDSVASPADVERVRAWIAAGATEHCE